MKGIKIIQQVSFHAEPFNVYIPLRKDKFVNHNRSVNL